MSARPAPLVLLACCTVVDGALAVLVQPGSGRRSALPSAPVPTRGSIEDAAAELAKRLTGRVPAWSVQAGASVDAGLTITVAAVVPSGTAAQAGAAWLPMEQLAAALAADGVAAVRAAVSAMQDRLDREPVAFRLLPPTFTLTELQERYELLLERRLHKASFRRALLAAHLVEPTEHWRSEGRGRPAQLFRFSPRRRRGVQRSVRFEHLG